MNWMTRRRHGRRSLSAIAVAGLMAGSVLLSGCGTGGGTRIATELQTGAARSLGNGRAQSFVTTNAAGVPQSINIRLSPGALDGLPTDMAEFIVDVPEVVKGYPYNHIGLDWNPGGHEPPGVYDIPHFDMHFYLIDEAARNQITAQGADIARLEAAPSPGEIPAGYVPTPGGVPRMGAHWISPASGEFNGKTFDKTFIYGFYNGDMVFMEPMITRALLAGETDFSAPIPQPTQYPKPGLYPTTYSVSREADGSVVITLGGLVERR